MFHRSWENSRIHLEFPIYSCILSNLCAIIFFHQFIKASSICFCVTHRTRWLIGIRSTSKNFTSNIRNFSAKSHGNNFKFFSLSDGWVYEGNEQWFSCSAKAIKLKTLVKGERASVNIFWHLNLNVLKNLFALSTMSLGSFFQKKLKIIMEYFFIANPIKGHASWSIKNTTSTNNS